MRYKLKVYSDNGDLLMEVEAHSSEFLDAHIGSFERSEIYKRVKSEEQSEPIPF